ncbi:hypothetical protein [Streptomyces sp. NPDC015130]|uniref:hypothetical protein n=1 Tax=Streptomyces sp. NPDC015130 TaxID=3364940 RepID=UPI0036FCC409
MARPTIVHGITRDGHHTTHCITPTSRTSEHRTDCPCHTVDTRPARIRRRRKPTTNA